MHSVFETAPAASAISIIFATGSTWDAIRAELAGAGPAIRAQPMALPPNPARA